MSWRIMKSGNRPSSAQRMMVCIMVTPSLLIHVCIGQRKETLRFGDGEEPWEEDGDFALVGCIGFSSFAKRFAFDVGNPG